MAKVLYYDPTSNLARVACEYLAEAGHEADCYDLYVDALKKLDDDPNYDAIIVGSSLGNGLSFLEGAQKQVKDAEKVPHFAILSISPIRIKEHVNSLPISVDIVQKETDQMDTLVQLVNKLDK